MANRLRHSYAVREDPTAWGYRGMRTIKALNYLRLKGGMSLSAIPDLARPVMVNGVGDTMDGLVQVLWQFSKARLSLEEVKLAGTALDMVLDTRVMMLSDIMDDFGGHSSFEKALSAAQSNFGLVSLMAP